MTASKRGSVVVCTVFLTSSWRRLLFTWGYWVSALGARCTSSSIFGLFQPIFLWSPFGGHRGWSRMPRNGMSPRRRRRNLSLWLYRPQFLRYGQLLPCFFVAAVDRGCLVVVFFWRGHRAGIRSALRFCKSGSRDAHLSRNFWVCQWGCHS